MDNKLIYKEIGKGEAGSSGPSNVHVNVNIPEMSELLALAQSCDFKPNFTFSPTAPQINIQPQEIKVEVTEKSSKQIDLAIDELRHLTLAMCRADVHLENVVNYMFYIMLTGFFFSGSVLGFLAYITIREFL